MPLVPDVISRLCSTVPTEMRHSRDIVQACPGGGPVIPNQSLAVQRLERKIRTQEFRFFSSAAVFFFFFFNECLIQNCIFFSPPSSSSCSFCLASHQLSFRFIHHYLHIILIISTLSLASADGFVRLCVSRRHFWVQAVLDRQTKHVLGWKCRACVCVCVRSLFLLLCRAICNTSQMNTDLFNCINSSL